jgi:hypothetical protein
MKKRLFALVLSCVCLGNVRGVDAGTQAQALNNFLVQHGYGWTRLDVSTPNQTFLAVTINGDDRRMLLDSGFYKTSLSWTAAMNLDLQVKPTKHLTIGIGGKVEGAQGVAIINSFKIGPYEINRVNPITVLSPDARLPLQCAGYFGLDYLALNAAVVPVGADLLFYKPGPRPPAEIAAYMQQLGFRGVPPKIVAGTGLTVEGALGEHPFRAVVDSGAQYTTFDYKLAAAIDSNIKPINLRMEGVDGQLTSVYGFTPKTIQLGGVVLPGAFVAASKEWILGRHRIDGLIGYDFLAPHHAIVDFGHLVLWLK